MLLRSRTTLAMIAISLTAAVSASLMTAWLFSNHPEVFGILPSTTEAPSSRLTSETQAITRPPTFPTTTKPTQTQPEPTLIDPDVLSEQAKEQLALLTSGQLIEALYAKVAPSVVGVQVLVEGDASTSSLTDSGSGIIYSADGLILTSADLLTVATNRYGELQANTQILVRVSDVSQPFPASLIGRDRLTGVAVLSIKPGPIRLQPARLSTDHNLKVGQHVFFASYPDDLIASGSLTSGMINALHQPVQLEDGTSVEMIRADAPILANGNGGPLINLEGEVIALSNSSQLSDTNDSLSYAMPALTVQTVADNLINKGYVTGRAWLGIAVLKDESFAELQNLYHFPDGLYVSHVIVDSPAYIADLRRGDIITAVNGEPVSRHQSLTALLAKHAAGDQLVIEVYRRSDGKTHELTAYLKEYVE